ncbi:hypothetical protein Tco_1297391 [Tanacetum coccineum]
MLHEPHCGDGVGEDPSRPPPTHRKKESEKPQFGRVEKDGRKPGESLRITSCRIETERWPRIEGYIQAQRGKPDEYTDDEWEKYINFWNDPANAQRAETNRLNRSKSTVVSRHGSRSIPLTRHLMKQASATQEEPSEIDTFYRLFQDHEALRMYDRMRELEATGEHTTAEINAMVRGGKLHGHIPGVGPVMPGYVIRSDYTLKYIYII